MSNAKEIVARLRALYTQGHDNDPHEPDEDCQQAADLIESQAKRILELEESITKYEMLEKWSSTNS